MTCVIPTTTTCWFFVFSIKLRDARVWNHGTVPYLIDDVPASYVVWLMSINLYLSPTARWKRRVSSLYFGGTAISVGRPRSNTNTTFYSLRCPITQHQFVDT